MPKSDCSVDEDEKLQHDADELSNTMAVEVQRSKRIRNESEGCEGYEDEEGFITINRKSKRLFRSYSKDENIQNQMEEECDKFEVCVTCNEPLPKQIALAKLLKKYNIGDIKRIKYKNRFKVLLSFDSQEKADVLVNCKDIQGLGLRCQMTSQLSLCYGVVKQMDLEIDIKELESTLNCEYDITSLLRLKRLNDVGKWIESEAIRICFRGSVLPMYVYGFGCRFKVEPYTFPVSQCSGCWKYGHSRKFCPVKKIFCPKCGKSHENCETSVYKCINCGGPHMALNKICPIFLKEKAIRDLMSKETCSYRKALSIFLRNKQPDNDTEPVMVQTNLTSQSTTYRDVLLSRTTGIEQSIIQDKIETETEEIHTGTVKKKTKKSKTKQQFKKKKGNKEVYECGKAVVDSDSCEDVTSTEEVNSSKCNKVKNKLRDIFYKLKISSDKNIDGKIGAVCQLLFEEISNFIVVTVSDGHFISKIMNNIFNG